MPASSASPAAALRTQHRLPLAVSPRYHLHPAQQPPTRAPPGPFHPISPPPSAQLRLCGAPGPCPGSPGPVPCPLSPRPPPYRRRPQQERARASAARRGLRQRRLSAAAGAGPEPPGRSQARHGPPGPRSRHHTRPKGCFATCYRALAQIRFCF